MKLKHISSSNMLEEYRLLSSLSFNHMEIHEMFSAPGKESAVFYLLFYSSLQHEQLIHQQQTLDPKPLASVLFLSSYSCITNLYRGNSTSL